MMKTRDLLVVGAVFLATCIGSLSRANAQGGAAQVSQAMVRALHDNHIGRTNSRPPDGERSARTDFNFRVVDTSLEVTGEALSPIQKATAAFNIGRGFDSRQPLGPDIMAMYESRLRNIGKATVEQWLAAEGPDAVGDSTTLTLIFIATRDYLFEGSRWKPGHPSRALARRSSIPKDAFTKWTDLVRSGGDELDDPLTIISVDGLFSNDKFQQQVFDAALLAAQKLLSPR